MLASVSSSFSAARARELVTGQRFAPWVAYDDLLDAAPLNSTCALPYTSSFPLLSLSARVRFQFLVFQPIWTHSNITGSNRAESLGFVSLKLR
jgi:hypothetical protein